MRSTAKAFMVLLILLLLPVLVWAGTWEKVEVISAPPLAGHTCVFDSNNSNMYLFGDAKLTDGNIYRVNLAVADKNMMVIASSDTVKRFGHSAVYDTNANRIIVFGGKTGTNYNDQVSNTVYTFDTLTRTWDVFSTTGTDIPVARRAHSAVFDQQFNRMIIYGGWNVDMIALSDTYILDLNVTPAEWSKANLSYEAPARWQATAIFDPVRKRMVIFGGVTTDNEPTNELWYLNLSSANLTGQRWTQLFPTNNTSSGLARTAHVLVYNPDTDHLLVYGGWAPLTLTEAFYDTTYAFDFNSRTWWLVAPGPDIPKSRRNASGIYDPIRKKMVIFGGAFGSDIYAEIFSDMYALSEETNWAPAKGKGEIYNFPNPFNNSSGKTTIKFYCDSAREVKITIYSLIGELVKDWTINGVKGINSLEWDGANGDGKKVESGGYICVINKGGAKSKFKIGVIR
ncbi:MAG: T9SS type A sorting domain-containing protein [Elusimicrobia bacterium]|nr:T9SS type A sorting domain-containing protein [Elusimicrobiota bacterium]